MSTVSRPLHVGRLHHPVPGSPAYSRGLRWFRVMSHTTEVRPRQPPDLLQLHALRKVCGIPLELASVMFHRSLPPRSVHPPCLPDLERAYRVELKLAVSRCSSAACGQWRLCTFVSPCFITFATVIFFVLQLLLCRSSGRIFASTSACRRRCLSRHLRRKFGATFRFTSRTRARAPRTTSSALRGCCSVWGRPRWPLWAAARACSPATATWYVQ